MCLIVLILEQIPVVNSHSFHYKPSVTKKKPFWYFIVKLVTFEAKIKEQLMFSSWQYPNLKRMFKPTNWGFGLPGRS